MNRSSGISGILLWTLSLGAQEQIVSTRVFTEPAGAQFSVDGKVYISAQVFLWPKGSKHVLSFDRRFRSLPASAHDTPSPRGRIHGTSVGRHAPASP